MKRNIYRLIMSALFVSVGLTSCLNDDMVDDQKYGLINLNAKKIIELPSDASHSVSKTLLPSGLADVTIGEVRLAAEQAATEDIVVGLSTSKTSELLVGKDLFPLDKITVPATVTILKGQRSAPLVVKVNTDYLLSDPQYLAITITTVDKPGYTVSGNFGHLFFSMKVKHKYAGRYVLTGTMVNYPNPTLFHVTQSWEINHPGEPYTVQLQTNDGSSLIFYDELLREDNLYPIGTAPSGYSAWGSFCPIFKFDSAGNIIAVTNAYGQPASNTRSAVLDPSGVNKYDAATKSFKVSYYMVQPSVVATAPHYRCHFVETYTYKEDL